jgi:hypothetical protein
MLQTASTTNATQRPDRHRVAVLASDHDPILAIRMCPHLVRAGLAHDAPAASVNAFLTALYFFATQGPYG